MDYRDLPRPPRFGDRPGTFSFLVIGAAFLLVCYGAAIFAKGMSDQITGLAIKVAMTDQLNSASFLARELSGTARPAPLATGPLPERAPGSTAVDTAAARYRPTFDSFTNRHGVRAVVVDSRTHELVLTGPAPLSIEDTLEGLPQLGTRTAPEPLTRVIARRAKVQGVIIDRGQRFLGTLVPIPGTSHVVVLYRLEEDIVRAGEHLASRFTTYLLVTFGLLLGFFVLFLRSFTKPLRDLTRAAEKIGEGEFDQNVEVANSSEVRSLAEAFNQMSRELRVKYRELAETSARLEDSNRRFREVLESSRRQNAELQVLNSIVYEASRHMDSEHNLGYLADLIQHDFALALVAIFLYNGGRWELECASDPLFETCDFEAGGLGGELAALAAKRKVRLAHPGIIGPSRGTNFSAQFADGGLCLIPIIVQGQLEGAFVLVHHERAAFSASTIARYLRLSHQLGIILHKDALLTATIKRREQLEKLNQLGAALLEEPDLDRMVPRLLGELSATMNAEQAMLGLLDGSGTLQILAVVESSGAIAPLVQPHEDCWNQRVLAEGQPVRIGQYPRLNLWSLDGQPLSGSDLTRFKSYLGLPLRKGGQVIGVLALLSEREHEYDEDDETFLSSFANHLSTALQNARLFQEIATRDQRRNLQLATAKKFQADRIPTVYDDGTLEARITLLPADELAGDFFDVFRLSPHVTSFVIGDVATKGVAASLLTFSMLSIFRNLATTMRPPAKVMEMANETTRAQLKEDFWFVTAFYARINHSERSMTYCKAGHVLPVLYRAAEKRCELLDGDGLPLGIMDETDYVGAQVDLAPGDRVILYTDGVIELKSGEGQQFGVDRLCEVIAAHGDNSTDEIRQGILDALDAWTIPGISRDDILIAVVGLNRDPWIIRDIPYGDMDATIDKIMEGLRCFPLTGTCLYAIRLGLNETIANAHHHGNLENEELPITLSYRITESFFALRVRDSGVGFDYENLPDPTVPENLILTHGRGIYLMRQMMDELEFNENGNEIRVRKNFEFEPSASAAPASARNALAS